MTRGYDGRLHPVLFSIFCREHETAIQGYCFDGRVSFCVTFCVTFCVCFWISGYESLWTAWLREWGGSLWDSAEGIRMRGAVLLYPAVFARNSSLVFLAVIYCMW